MTLVLERRKSRFYQPASHVKIEELGADSTRGALLPLIRFLRRERPTVVYAALPHLNALAAAACQLVRPHPRLVISVHNNQQRELPNLAGGAFWARVTPWVYRAANAIVAVSDGVADEARGFRRSASKVRVIHDPVDVEAIGAAAAEKIDHQWLSGAYDVITAMGRLTWQKDFHLLLRAFSNVREKNENARLLVLGDGELRESLERSRSALRLDDSVEFMGFIQNPFPFIARSKCFVLSSRFEGFGMALVEAMATGTAVVSTDCPFGPAEILGDGQWGLLAKPGSAAALTDCLSRVIDDVGLRSRLAAAGKLRARDFDTTVVVPRLAQMLRDLGDSPWP